MDESLRNLALVAGGVAGVALLLAILLLAVIVVAVRRIQVPPGAGFAETMFYTPLVVVIFLDLLDLAMDFLAAPIAWVVLDRIGLKGLRGVAVVEGLIPFTNFIPLMTASWIVVRVLGKERVLGNRYLEF